MSTAVNSAKGDFTIEGGELAADRAARRRRNLAWIWCSLLVFVNVNLGEWVQHFERSSYYKPMFMSWFLHNNGLVFLAPFAVEWVQKRAARARGGLTGIGSEDVAGAPAFPWRKFLTDTFVMNALLTFGEYCWYVALPRISVSSSFGIENSQPALVFVFSVIFLAEAATWMKLGGLLVGLLGVILVTLSKEQEEASIGGSGFGYFMSACTMAIFAYWKVYSRKALQTDTIKDACFTLGFMGVWNIALFWLLVPLVGMLGFETFEMPSFSVVMSMLFLALLDGLSNFFNFLTIQNSSPLFTSVGMLMTIPTAMLVDIVVQHYFMGSLAFTGLLCILASFAMINVLDMVTSERFNHILEPLNRPRPLRSIFCPNAAPAPLL